MPKKAAPKKKDEGPLNLRVEDVGCPICLEILVEPITMPCDHTLCKPCFSKNSQLTSLNCPFCKKRIGTWHRRAKDVDTLIDQRLWAYIQDNFGDKVEARLKADEQGAAADADIFQEVWFSHNLVEEGQIGQEFQSQLQELQKEERARQEKDELKSRALIKKLLEGNSSQDEEDSGPPQEVTTQDLLDDVDVSDVMVTPTVASSDVTVVTPFDREFLKRQKAAEELIAQQKLDEELAKRLQAEEESSPVSTRSSPKGKAAKDIKKANSSGLLRRYLETPKAGPSQQPRSLPELPKLDPEFLRMQKVQEEKLSQSRQDEEYAKRLQEQLSSPVLTRSSPKGKAGKENKKVNHSSDVRRYLETTTPKAGASKPGPSNPDISDEELARRLQEDEEKLMTSPTANLKTPKQSSKTSTPNRTVKRPPEGPRQMTMDEMAKRRKIQA